MSVAELEAREIQLEAPSGLWSEAWRRLRRNPAAIAGFLLVGVFIFVAVLAARSVGVPGRTILGAHVLPNAISPVIVQGTLALATAIIDVAGLGFLGLGPTDPSTPEWGTMLTDTTRFLQTAPHLALIPGAAIVVSVLGFNLIGDGLREALDPRFRGRASRAAPLGGRPRGPL